MTIESIVQTLQLLRDGRILYDFFMVWFYQATETGGVALPDEMEAFCEQQVHFGAAYYDRVAIPDNLIRHVVRLLALPEGSVPGHPWSSPDCQLRDTFAYYDRPVLFTMATASGDVYLVTLCDEWENHVELWLAARLSSPMLRRVQLGEIDFYHAFMGAEGGVAWLTVGDAPALPIAAANLTDDMLPAKGERVTNS